MYYMYITYIAYVICTYNMNFSTCRLSSGMPEKSLQVENACSPIIFHVGLYMDHYDN